RAKKRLENVLEEARKVAADPDFKSIGKLAEQAGLNVRTGVSHPIISTRAGKTLKNFSYTSISREKALDIVSAIIRNLNLDHLLQEVDYKNRIKILENFIKPDRGKFVRELANLLIDMKGEKEKMEAAPKKDVKEAVAKHRSNKERKAARVRVAPARPVQVVKPVSEKQSEPVAKQVLGVIERAVPEEIRPREPTGDIRLSQTEKTQPEVKVSRPRPSVMRQERLPGKGSVRKAMKKIWPVVFAVILAVSLSVIVYISYKIILLSRDEKPPVVQGERIYAEWLVNKDPQSLSRRRGAVTDLIRMSSLTVRETEALRNIAQDISEDAVLRHLAIRALGIHGSRIEDFEAINAVIDHYRLILMREYREFERGRMKKKAYEAKVRSPLEYLEVSWWAMDRIITFGKMPLGEFRLEVLEGLQRHFEGCAVAASHFYGRLVFLGAHQKKPKLLSFVSPDVVREIRKDKRFTEAFGQGLGFNGMALEEFAVISDDYPCKKLIDDFLSQRSGKKSLVVLEWEQRVRLRTASREIFKERGLSAQEAEAASFKLLGFIHFVDRKQIDIPGDQLVFKFIGPFAGELGIDIDNRLFAKPDEAARDKEVLAAVVEIWLNKKIPAIASSENSPTSHVLRLTSNIRHREPRNSANSSPAKKLSIPVGKAVDFNITKKIGKKYVFKANA
ncbi:MAG: hypothetical protein V1863_07615, partial [Candidatus Omnitrophota bacterium]